MIAAGVGLTALCGVLLTQRGNDPHPSHPGQHRLTTRPAPAPTHALRPTPVRPSARPAADPFAGGASSYLASRAGQVEAAAYDLSTGQRWTIGSGPPQAAASVIKIDILETLLAERARSGGTLSAPEQQQARQMIEDSDNDAATALWNEAGAAPGIRSFNGVAGLAGTTPSSCVECPHFPWPGWGLSTTTPADQITLLRQLVQPSRLIPAGERRYAIGLMEDVTASQRWGVSGGVPAGVSIALKNGWLPLNSADSDWQVNSVGWVSGQGRNYLLAVVTTGDPSEQYGIDTIGQLSAMTWQQLAPRPAPGTRPS